MRRLLLLMLSFLVVQVVGQDNTQWEEKEVKDPFTGKEFTQFTLQGKYLAAPTDNSAMPFLTLRCKRGVHSVVTRKFDGTLIEAFLFVGQTVVDAGIGYDASPKVEMQYRLDDGKIQRAFLHRSKNFKAVSLKESCVECLVENLLYAHEFPHKEGTNPQVKKVVVKIPEYLGADVVIQFDMPDATEVAKSCGVTYHK